MATGNELMLLRAMTFTNHESIDYGVEQSQRLSPFLIRDFFARILAFRASWDDEDIFPFT